LLDIYTRIAEITSKGWPVITMRRGEIIAKNGKPVEPRTVGTYVSRKASLNTQVDQ